MPLFSIIALIAVVGVGQKAPPKPDPSHLGSVNLHCGAYCLFASLRALESPCPNFEALEKKLGQPTALGYSMEQLQEAASAFQAHVLGVETTLENLERRPHRFACIALLQESGHYVCIYDVDSEYVYLVDPPEHRKVPREAFAKLWSGKALLISDQPIDLQLPTRFSLWWMVLVLLIPGVWIAARWIRRGF